MRELAVRDADKPVFPIWASGRHDSCGRYVREACIFREYGRGVEG